MSRESSPTVPRAASGPGVWLHMYGPALWAAVVLLAGLYLLTVANEIPYPSRPGRLGPAFWPRAILIMMTLTAAVDCVVEARKAPDRFATLAAGNATSTGVRRVWWMMALGLAFTLAYINLSTVLGFPLATMLFMVVFMLLGGFRRPALSVIISTLGTIILVALFVKVVYVSLPLGVGPFESLTLLLYALLGIV